MNVPSDAVGFELELPDRVIKVMDTKKPIWHGSYADGLLTIYSAETLSGVVVPNTITVVSVYSVTGDQQQEDFVAINYYAGNVSLEEVAEHIKDTVIESYTEVKTKQVLQAASNKSKYMH